MYRSTVFNSKLKLDRFTTHSFHTGMIISENVTFSLFPTYSNFSQVFINKIRKYIEEVAFRICVFVIICSFIWHLLFDISSAFKSYAITSTPNTSHDCREAKKSRYFVLILCKKYEEYSIFYCFMLYAGSCCIGGL